MLNQKRNVEFLKFPRDFIKILFMQSYCLQSKDIFYIRKRIQKHKYFAALNTRLMLVCAVHFPLSLFIYTYKHNGYNSKQRRSV